MTRPHIPPAIIAYLTKGHAAHRTGPITNRQRNAALIDAGEDGLFDWWKFAVDGVLSISLAMLFLVIVL